MNREKEKNDKKGKSQNSLVLIFDELKLKKLERC